MGGYPNPRAIEIGLIEANNLLDEVASRAEPASLSEKKRGLGIVQARTHVKYSFKVAVQPIVSCHLYSASCCCQGEFKQVYVIGNTFLHRPRLPSHHGGY